MRNVLDSCMPLATCAACCVLLLASATTARADDGDADPSFSGDGYATQSWPLDTIQVQTTAAAASRDGGVITASMYSYPGPQQLGVVALSRFRADGAVDAGFGSGGLVLVDFDPAPRLFEYPRGVFELADRKLLVVAAVDREELSNDNRLALARLHPDGSPDESFGAGGKRFVDFPGAPWLSGGEMQVRAVALQADGKIVIAALASPCGTSGYNALVLRLLANGSPDSSFGTGGWQCLDVLDESSGSAVAIDESGRTLVAGYAQANGQPAQPFVARLTASGAQDSGFQGGGFALIDCPEPATDCISTAIVGGRYGAGQFSFSRIFVVAIQSSAGQTSSNVIGLQNDGDLDSGFANNGILDLTLEQGTQINALTLRKDRRLVAAGGIFPNGSKNDDFFAARFLFDGTLDDSFDGNGVNRYVFPGNDSTYERANVMVLSAERPVLVGAFYDITAPVGFVTGVLRLQSDLIFTSEFE